MSTSLLTLDQYLTTRPVRVILHSNGSITKEYMNKNTDLDVDSPNKVSQVLRVAAEAYYESSVELEGAWQDKNAGKVWAQIAKVLESAANRIDKLV